MTPEERVYQELQAIHTTMASGFTYLSARIDQVARRVGVDEKELATLRREVAPIVRSASRARKLVMAAAFAAATVFGGAGAAYVLTRMGLSAPHVELNPPEIARP